MFTSGNTKPALNITLPAHQPFRIAAASLFQQECFAVHCNYFRVTHPSLVLFPENLQKPPVLQVSFFLAKHKKQSRRAWLQGTLGGSLAIPSKWRVLGLTPSMVRITPELSPYSALQCCLGYSPLQLYQPSFLKEQYWWFSYPVLNCLKLILNQRVVSKQCLHNGFLQTHNLPNKSSFPESH